LFTPYYVQFLLLVDKSTEIMAKNLQQNNDNFMKNKHIKFYYD